MDAPDLPEDVLRFLLDRIESVPHLEVLLLLWQNPQTLWSLEQIAMRVYVTPGTAAGLVSDLASAGMIAADAGTPESYRYDPAWDQGGLLMPRVAATYSRHLVRVAQLIHSKASPGVREFARAFQFKKDRN
jgi:hypothetical protein